MIEELLKELAELPEVEAIALGGSRAGETYDEKSDYDVYLYCTGDIKEEVREQILCRYCGRMEIGNHFWEYEDNCTLHNGIDIDILYRNLEAFCNDVASVVEKHQARNGYTTCMWHNLKNCKVIYDRNGNLAAAKKRFAVPYPAELKENIIDRNMRLLHTAMPAYDGQIAKAVKRGDVVSINHRTAAFMESYFDILFALNELSHPGEKRMISYCKNNCKILPEKFEDNLNRMFQDLFVNRNEIEKDVKCIVGELEKVIFKCQIKHC